MPRTFSFLIVVCLFAAVANGATFTVTTTADSGGGSLREAILGANATAGPDTIAFAIPGAGVQTIVPLSALPAVTSPVIVDGYTQPGSSPNTLALGSNAVLLIELNGTTAGGTGLVLQSGAAGSTVRGLVINRFDVGLLVDNAEGVVVTGNRIGTDAAGGVDLGNTTAGVGLTNGTRNAAIGGSTPGERNVISGNGTQISAGNSSSPAIAIRGNYLGLNASGTAALAGNAGIAVDGSGPVTIGGAGAAGNHIGGNSIGGVVISNGISSLVEVLGNTIGLTSTGSPAANGRGVYVHGGPAGAPSNVHIGSAAAPNVISGNANDGITVKELNGFAPTGVRIRSNSIHGNGSIGIDLGDNEVTGNDTLDWDGGANRSQNYPGLTSAHVLGGHLTVSGVLESALSSSYTLQFFRNAVCDPISWTSNGFGEGETFLGETVVTTDGAGIAAFAASFLPRSPTES